MKFKKLFVLALVSILGGTQTFAAEKETSPYTGITIEQAAGRTDLYLYNVESGYWLQENNRRSDSWNTRGELDAYGFDVAITAIEGGYQINPKFGHNNSLNSSNWYLDTGDAVTAWTFESIEKAGVSNAYKIKAPNGNWMHAMPEDDANASFGLIVNDRDVRSTWQIVTKEERLNYLVENATEDNPLDATFLIQGFNLANEDTRVGSNWVQVMDSGNSDWNRAGDTRCVQAHGFWNSKTSSYTQTITGVPDGTYEFYCTGFYRDGDRDQCQERRQNGTETIRGFMVLGDERAPLKSILDGAQSEAGNGFAYHNESYTYGYFPDGGDDVCRAFFNKPDAYLNAPVRATIVGGTIKLGIDKTEYTGGGDWVFFSRFRLRYLGPIDISEYTDALNSAIAAAEAFTGNTTDVLAADLATALAAAKQLVADNSHDTDAIGAATVALNTALDAAKAVDVTALRATIPLAQAAGIDVTAAEDYVANGTEPNSDILFSLQSQRKMKAMRYFDEATVAALVGAEPKDGESYYLLNVGTGMFFACNSDWGTHMALDSKGFLVKLIADGETGGMTDYHVSGKESVGWDGFNWGEEYFDKNGESKWHFVPVAGKTNVYNFAIFDNHDWHILYDPNNLRTDGDRYFNVLKKINGKGYESNPYAQWILLTPAQRTELLAKATPANPIDATHFIENPNFNKSKASGSDDTKYGWTGIGTVGNYGRYADYVAEFFETTADAKTVVTGLPAGRYQVRVSGFYREKSFENDIDLYNNGADSYSDHAKLVAFTDDDRVEANFMHISVEHGKLPGVGNTWAALGGDNLPWGMADAAQYFETGLYRLTTDVITVGEDGKLTIGVEKPNSTGNDANWIVFDNFQLVCLGTDLNLADDADNKAAIAAVDGVEKNVTVTRKFTKDQWNTVVLPFAVDDVEATFGAGAKVAKLDNEDETGVLHFVSTTTIEAGVPYLVKPTTEVTAVKATAQVKAAQADVQGLTYDFVGIYAPTAPAAEDYFLGAESTLKKNTANTNLKAFRGFFKAVSGEAKGLTGFTVDGETTGVINIDGTVDENAPVYNLAGQRMNAVQKGVYIQNGKKVVK